MKETLPLLIAMVYFIVAIDHFRSGQYGWTITWLAYSIANVGLVMAAKNI